MNVAAIRAIDAGLRGQYRRQEPLARYTTWRVGGPAEHYFRPADIADLQCFLTGLDRDEPLFWLGLGSNLLVRDGGIQGCVISTHTALQKLAREAEQRIRVEAGVPCAKVARFAARCDLSGAEFLAGIPGTMGGALAMNAGAWGGETWPLVKGVETVDRNGILRYRSPADFEIGYRHVRGPEDEWFVAAHLGLTAGDGQAGLERIKSLLDARGRSQPTGVASCGSVFRNPPGGYAAQLIESAGLKGLQVGGAQVSLKHANFIINTGTATAQDLETLLRTVARTVEEVHGVRLVSEVVIVGEPLAEQAITRREAGGAQQ